jgi:hypothetical protein
VDVQSLLHLAASMVLGTKPDEKIVQDDITIDSKHIAAVDLIFFNFP